MSSVYYQAFQEFATFLLSCKIVLQNPQFSMNATIAHTTNCIFKVDYSIVSEVLYM